MIISRVRLSWARLFFSATCILMLMACGMQSDTQDKNNAIRAVTENAYPPLNFANAQGKGVGLEYDLTNQIAQMISRPIQWHLSNWDVMIQSVRQEMFDVAMDGITITAEREKEVDFSIPYIKISQIMLVRSDETQFASSGEFIANPNLKIGVQPGTTGFYVATDMVKTSPENPGPRLVSFENFGASVQALVAGDIDMIIMDESAAKRWINSTAGRLKTIEEVLSSEEIAYIFPKGSPLVAEFNTAIEQLKANGSLDKMVTYWFGEYEE
ncbi:MAG: substrate-binding periplasmic protein [Spirochaetia bacterium]